MATYVVTVQDEDWEGRMAAFKTRPPADEMLADLAAQGRFARLIRWDHPNLPTEVTRVNDTPEGRRRSAARGHGPA